MAPAPAVHENNRQLVLVGSDRTVSEIGQSVERQQGVLRDEDEVLPKPGIIGTLRWTAVGVALGE
jgi:hypothetical protein